MPLFLVHFIDVPRLSENLSELVHLVCKEPLRLLARCASLSVALNVFLDPLLLLLNQAVLEVLPELLHLLGELLQL